MNPEREQATIDLDIDTSMAEKAREVLVEVVKAEEPADYWQAQGFLPDIARICNDLEGEREQFMLSSEVRQIIETVSNAQSVEDFTRYTNNDLNEFRNKILRRLPEAERAVIGLVNQVTRARTVAVESIDFI